MHFDLPAISHLLGPTLHKVHPTLHKVCPMLHKVRKVCGPEHEGDSGHDLDGGDGARRGPQAAVAPFEIPLVRAFYGRNDHRVSGPMVSGWERFLSPEGSR